MHPWRTLPECSQASLVDRGDEVFTHVLRDTATGAKTNRFQVFPFLPPKEWGRRHPLVYERDTDGLSVPGWRRCGFEVEGDERAHSPLQQRLCQGYRDYHSARDQGLAVFDA